MTGACPICGGLLESDNLRLRENILYWRGGSTPLGPVAHAIVLMMKANPSGVTTNAIAERTGQTTLCTGVQIWHLKKKLKVIGWTIRNIGSKGNSYALYVLGRA